jgi:ubiquinone/menaquinone biosynthesis C-methylase UbiE
MNSIRFKIKDECRQNLCKYLSQAISVLPPFEKPTILDMGCGTGVPTLTLAKYYNGVILAIDTDKEALDCIISKLTTQVVSSNIIVECRSANEIEFPLQNFDIVLAEGLLNIIGFENGLRLVSRYLKQNGFFIIHDEYKNHSAKLEVIKSNGY